MNSWSKGAKGSRPEPHQVSSTTSSGAANFGLNLSGAQSFLEEGGGLGFRVGGDVKGGLSDSSLGPEAMAGGRQRFGKGVPLPSSRYGLRLRARAFHG